MQRSGSSPTFHAASSSESRVAARLNAALQRQEQTDTFQLWEREQQLQREALEVAALAAALEAAALGGGAAAAEPSLAPPASLWWSLEPPAVGAGFEPWMIGARLAEVSFYWADSEYGDCVPTSAASHLWPPAFRIKGEDVRGYTPWQGDLVLAWDFTWDEEEDSTQDMPVPRGWLVVKKEQGKEWGFGHAWGMGRQQPEDEASEERASDWAGGALWPGADGALSTLEEFSVPGRSHHLSSPSAGPTSWEPSASSAGPTRVEGLVPRAPADQQLHIMADKLRHQAWCLEQIADNL